MSKIDDEESIRNRKAHQAFSEGRHQKKKTTTVFKCKATHTDSQKKLDKEKQSQEKGVATHDA